MFIPSQIHDPVELLTLRVVLREGPQCFERSRCTYASLDFEQRSAVRVFPFGLPSPVTVAAFNRRAA